jgi:rod shape-determining protein MreD
VSGWIAYPILALLVALQTSLVPQLAVGDAHPELVLTWVICWAVVRGRGEAVPWAIFSGLLLDLLSQQPMGAHLLALTLVAFLADLGHRVMHGSTVLFAASATLMASLVYGGILLLLAPGARQLDLPAAFLRLVVPSAAYNLALSFPVLLILRGLDRRFPVPVAPELW